MRFDELHRLLTTRLEGRATDEETARLVRLLDQDPEVRRQYIRYMSDSVSLHQRPSAPAAGAERTWWARWSGRLGWATAFAACLILSAALWRQREALATYRGVAVLTGAVDAEWEGARPTTGAVLRPGRLSLRRGLAQIELFSGATVVVEAPAELELVSSMEISLARGRARATVPPPARGFVINGRGVGVVDLGTEFGISVDEAGSALHVFEGEVQLRGDGRRLKAGEDLAVTAAGAARVAARPSFVDRASLARRAEDQVQERRARWEAASAKLRQDPSLVVYYTFEDQQPWDRVVASRAAGGGEISAAIVGCRFTTGRWPTKKALEWKSPGDRVRMEVPGQFDSMTFVAWVRFDGFDRKYISLFLTDDWDRGEPHWQVSRKGEMILGVSGPGNHWSPPVLSAVHLGRWVHLATVYDAGSHTVSHFVDGVRVAQAPIQGHVPLVIGAAEIGNWGMPLDGTKEEQIRNLNGAIDEVALFGRALGDTEIAGLYEAGRPQ